jgi:outer membrane protein assembly factor BamD (BamD/ComL family)
VIEVIIGYFSKGDSDLGTKKLEEKQETHHLTVRISFTHLKKGNMETAKKTFEAMRDAYIENAPKGSTCKLEILRED